MFGVVTSGRDPDTTNVNFCFLVGVLSGELKKFLSLPDLSPITFVTKNCYHRRRHRLSLQEYWVNGGIKEILAFWHMELRLLFGQNLLLRGLPCRQLRIMTSLWMRNLSQSLVRVDTPLQLIFPQFVNSHTSFFLLSWSFPSIRLHLSPTKNIFSWKYSHIGGCCLGGGGLSFYDWVGLVVALDVLLPPTCWEHVWFAPGTCTKAGSGRKSFLSLWQS